MEALLTRSPGIGLTRPRGSLPEQTGRARTAHVFCPEAVSRIPSRRVGRPFALLTLNFGSVTAPCSLRNGCHHSSE